MAALFHPLQLHAEMEEELRSHIEHRADDLERSGINRAEAERRARVEFGGHEKFREECHEVLGGRFIEIVLQDVRFALRVLRKFSRLRLRRGFDAGLGAIGANAVVFGVMDALCWLRGFQRSAHCQLIL
jgi:hypothetical protein